MGFFSSCRHWSFIVFSSLFLLVGVVFITLGTIYRVKFSEINRVIPPSCPYFELIPVLTIVLGGVISFISILGFGGFFKRSSCVLSAHTLILLIIFILQTGLGIFTFVEISHQNSLQTKVNKTVGSLFAQISDKMEVVDFVQKELECCGTDGPNFYTLHNITIPQTCYEDADKKEMYQTGCQRKVQDYLVDTVRIIGITVLALSVVEVIVAVLSMSLSNTIKEYNSKYKKYMK